MKKTAFTLIELLVVIAIIAILAAILFPVFAQAKAAAKAISAVSNTKQQALAVLMYQNDADDYFPMGTIWNTGTDELCFGTSPCLSTWAWVAAPYVKSPQLFNDPTATANPNYFNWGFPIVDSYMPEFGYNYTYLGYWAPTGANGATVPTATNSSQADGPSNTVMIASKWVHADQPDWANGTLWFSTIPGQAEDSAAESPECDNVTQWCFSDWGAGGQWDTGGIMAGTSVTDGRYTGGIAFRVTNGVTVGWVDGHATKTSPQKLAGGTNFNISAAAGQVGSSGNITILHAGVYPWMLAHNCSLDAASNCTQ